MDAVLSGAVRILTAIGLLLGPAAVASVALHLLERRTTRGLMSIAGRGAVLATGWLGVPVHEVSHAAMCVVFRHRIDRIVLFHPDPKSGTLGYVAHAWDRRSPWQVVGTFFVGIAPLLGGAAVILGLLELLLPGTLRLPDLTAPAGTGDAAGWGALGTAAGRSVEHTTRAIFTPANLGSWRLWLFLYATLCIGSHISPSPQDLRGSLWGALAFLAACAVAGAAAVAVGAGDSMTRLALAGGMTVGVLLTLVVAVNAPLAVVVAVLGRLRR